jgi:protein gp37
MATTKIEWAQVVWNPLAGCERISTGCTNCYAERMARRLSQNPATPAYHGLVDKNGRWTGEVRPVWDALDLPRRWKKPRVVFVNSMSDLFHEKVQFDFVHQVWDVMKGCPHHRFIVLTKRPERMKEYVNRIYRMEAMGASMGFWSHVAIGVSVEDQKTAQARILELVHTKGRWRFVSAEPLLGPVDWTPYFQIGTRGADGKVRRDIHMVIFGGESGPVARPCEVGWIRDGVRQCRAAGVAPFVKQLGSYAYLDVRYDRSISGWKRLKHPKGGDMVEWPEDVRVREWPAGWGL